MMVVAWNVHVMSWHVRDVNDVHAMFVTWNECAVLMLCLNFSLLFGQILHRLIIAEWLEKVVLEELKN